LNFIISLSKRFERTLKKGQPRRASL